MKARIIEIFQSIQGEGLWVGRPQIFVRFHGCKLQCTYCDTPLTHKSITQARIEYPPYSKKFETCPLEFSVEELNATIKRFDVPSLALTGGEPLEQAAFLKAWLPMISATHDILLETSGVETAALGEVLDHVDMVSLDIKIPSATGESPFWQIHDDFIRVASATGCYAKVVFDEKMTEEECGELLKLIKKYPEISFIFQPVSPLQKRDMKRILEIMQPFFSGFPGQVRLIPQVHKWLGIS